MAGCDCGRRLGHARRVADGVTAAPRVGRNPFPSIVEAHELTDTAAVGGRFADDASAPQLQWILLHLIQEYARHTGHLDIARELIDGKSGETP